MPPWSTPELAAAKADSIFILPKLLVRLSQRYRVSVHTMRYRLTEHPVHVADAVQRSGGGRIYSASVWRAVRSRRDFRPVSRWSEQHHRPVNHLEHGARGQRGGTAWQQPMRT